MTGSETEKMLEVCVCTFRRPAVRETLASLAELEAPEGLSVSVLVLDNDTTPSARSAVEAFRSRAPFDVRYVHCPAGNVSLARNACLNESKARYLAFIDDDETATPTWLSALYGRMQKTGADVVLGPVDAVYPDEAPSWMTKGDFHSMRPVWVQGQILTGHTCNVLIDQRARPIEGRRFDLALGRSGGEDTVFFAEAQRAGAAIDYAPDAQLYETVTPERAQLRWLLVRKFRSGQTHARLLDPKSLGARSREIGLALAKLLACAALAAGQIFSAVGLRRAMIRGALHAGTLSGLIGVRERALYGVPGKVGRFGT